MSKRLSVAALAAATMLAALCAQPAASEDFYKGKTVTIMVPSGLGASMGLYGRMLAKAMEKYIPGNPTVIVQSRPGAGGTKGQNYAYNAGPSDGTLIAMLSSGNVVTPKLRKMKYDMTKVNWIGSIAVRPSALWLWHASSVNTLDDAKKQEVILGSTGAGSGMSMWPKLMNAMLGTRFKVIEGYKGGAAVNKASEQGEVHGRWTSYSGLTAAKAQWLQKGKVKLLVQFGPKIPEQPKIPSIHDLVTGDNLKIVKFMELSESVGMGFWVRPEVPKDRVAILRKAFMAAVTDAEVVKAAAARKAPIDPLKGEEIEKLVADAYQIDDALIERMKKMTGAK
jgi:tripartite-type tricarboxylate transporter receptor subunit TctC